MLLVCLPFRQDSDVIMTSAPKFRQQSAILSSSVATTRTRGNYQLDLIEVSQIDIHMFTKKILYYKKEYFVIKYDTSIGGVKRN